MAEHSRSGEIKCEKIISNFARHGSAVVEHSTHDPKSKGLKHAFGTRKDRM